MEITQANLKSLIDFHTAEENVRAAVRKADMDKNLLRFFARYTAWNAPFGAGVASLASKMARAKNLFRDPKELIEIISDRSVMIASYVFDAARDEFNDHTLPHRATHRCLAQAMIGTMINQMYPMINQTSCSPDTIDSLNQYLKEPIWLQTLEQAVAYGYGLTSLDDVPAIFEALGYHLGSELLADMEFSVLDQYMHDHQQELVQYLNTNTYLIGKHRQIGMKWLQIHSGHGGGVEADHFLWATKSASRGLEFLPAEEHNRAGDAVKAGFVRFNKEHNTFFARVNDD